MSPLQCRLDLRGILDDPSATTQKQKILEDWFNVKTA